ncbi:MAG: NAD(P)H-binding protein [Leptospiraceae bacterium]|nr:NAD(P)H-binding protein [Leptospiraceae bacterium]
MKVFVYGGTGLVSGKLVELLNEKGHSVIAGSRNPNNQKSSDKLKWIETDALNPTKGQEGLKGVDALFLFSPPGFTNQYDILNPWIEAAKLNNVKKVVLMTAMGVDAAPPEVPMRKLELALENSGTPYVILRPNWFMQNFHTFWISGILSDRKIFFPGGDAKTSFIHSHDISASALAAIESDSFNNKSFALTGKEALTHYEVAEILTKACGNKVDYADITPEDFKKGLLGGGVPEDYSDFLVMIAGNLKAGYSAPITESVKELTGKDPKSFEEYAGENKDKWK